MYQKASSILLILLAATLFGVAGVQAQSSEDINVQARVITGLSIEGVQNLSLGEIAAGEIKRILWDGSVDGFSSAEEDVSAGIFRINASAPFRLQLSETNGAMIGPGDAQLPVTFFAAWNDSQTPPPSDNTVELDGSTSIQTDNSQADIYIFLGAEVEPPAEQARGIYETTITLTATYGID